jgi:hypothetical protein
MKHVRYLLITTITAAIAAGFPASAHDTLPQNWCMDPKSQPVIIGEFSFDETELISREPIHVPSSDIDKCGVVDRSAWHSAMHIGSATCENFAQGKDAQMIILSPESYSEKEHHSDYQFRDGLQGVCVVCPTPAPPRGVKPIKTLVPNRE